MEDTVFTAVTMILVLTLVVIAVKYFGLTETMTICTSLIGAMAIYSIRRG